MFSKNSRWTFHCFFLFIRLHLSLHTFSKAWQIFPPLGLSDLWQEITPPSLIWFSQAELVVESFVSHYTCFSREGNGTPLQYCFAWKIPWTEEPGRLQSMGSLRVKCDRATSLDFHALEKEMATHSSVLAWRIPGTGEPGGLPSMGSHRVGHDWSDLAAAAYMVFTSSWDLLHSFVHTFYLSFNFHWAVSPLCPHNLMVWRRVIVGYSICVKSN